ncbi:hypothetical protein F5Y19DRAFT_439401 [Xylariaceae sp. FL1651]|nr:hypothetical protein F5Y19DRAFT_439401 [Xylariaceae sp. FL1651]
MKSITIIISLFAAGVLSAPVSVDDAFNYTNNINNAADAKELNANTDAFNYHNNIDNAVTVTDADGTEVVLSSPYTDDVEAADPVKVLGEK